MSQQEMTQIMDQQTQDAKTENIYALVALIAGLFPFVSGMFYGIPLMALVDTAAPVVAIVFGVLAKKNPGLSSSRRSMATAGIVLGIVHLCLRMVLLFAVLAFYGVVVVIMIAYVAVAVIAYVFMLLYVLFTLAMF